MKSLLVFNLATDEADPILGFATGWIRALAEHVDTLDVITMRRGRFTLPGNVSVYSVGKEHGYTELRRAFNFYRILLRLPRTQYSACFAHMMPLFASMAFPLLRDRVPITLWYATEKVSLHLRLAERLASQIVSPNVESFPLQSSKVSPIGHGIDCHHFLPGGVARSVTSQVLCVGRIAPVKRLETAIEALRLLRVRHGLQATLRIVGPVHDTGYLEQLRKLARRALLESRVQFDGAMSYEDMPQVFRQADVLLHPSATGSLDKVVLEALACGVPVVTSNRATGAALGSVPEAGLVTDQDPRDLAEGCAHLLSENGDKRLTRSRFARRFVQDNHSLDKLCSTLIKHHLSLAPQRSGAI